MKIFANSTNSKTNLKNSANQRTYVAKNSVSFSGIKDIFARSTKKIAEPLTGEAGKDIGNLAHLETDLSYTSLKLGLTVTDPVDKMVMRAIDRLPFSP